MGNVPADAADVVDLDDARPRRRAPTSRTEHPRDLRKTVRRLQLLGADHDPHPDEYARPRTRGDCADGPRPCPWVSCRHHLLLDVLATGSIRYAFPHEDVELLPETCALDVADRGPVTLAEVGAIGNVTRERIRQVEGKALQRVQAALQREGVTADDHIIQPEAAGAYDGGDGSPGAAGVAEDDGREQEPAETCHARKAFLPPEHLAVVHALADRADPAAPAPPTDEELARLGLRALEHPPEDDGGWTARVWEAYLRSSAAHGHGPPAGIRYRADGRSYVYKPRSDAQKAAMFPARALPAAAPATEPAAPPAPTIAMQQEEGATVNDVELTTKRAHDALKESLGRLPTGPEVAKELGITKGAADQRLRKLRKLGEIEKPGVRSGRSVARESRTTDAPPAATPKKRRPGGVAGVALGTADANGHVLLRLGDAPPTPDGAVRVLRRERQRLAQRIEQIDAGLRKLEGGTP